MIFLRLFESLQIQYLPQAQVFSSRTRAMCFPCQVRWALRVGIQPLPAIWYNMTHIFDNVKVRIHANTQIQIIYKITAQKFEQDQQDQSSTNVFYLTTKSLLKDENHRTDSTPHRIEGSVFFEAGMPSWSNWTKIPSSRIPTRTAKTWDIEK